MPHNEHQLDDFFSAPAPQTAGAPSEREGDPVAARIFWRQRFRLLPKVLSFRERYSIAALALVVIASIALIPVALWRSSTVVGADTGGSFTEGILGEPRFINPVLSYANEVDRDLETLLFSGLLSFDTQGNLIPDLAKTFPEISSDGLNYTVYLKEHALWHDGKPVTADDVLFTIETIQNPDFGSPLRIAWQGVTVEKVNEFAVMFKLKTAYAQFPNTLTVGLIPKHIWQDIRPASFALHDLNTRPVGAGPYRFEKLEKDSVGRISSYTVRAFEDFHAGRPYIDRVTIQFFQSEDALIDAFKRRQIDSIAGISPKAQKEIGSPRRITYADTSIPRYFAVFFNQSRSALIADRNVRLALSHATDRDALITDVLHGKGVSVDRPFVESVLSIPDDVAAPAFDPEKAKAVLTADGWALGNDGIFAKRGTRLSLTLTTSTQPELADVAQRIATQWRTAGVELTVSSLSFVQLQQAIKDRSYDMLLFGVVMSLDPDPFPVWHSSQKREPGANISLYDNQTADAMLERARTTLNPLERASMYHDFQQIVVQDLPAIFLYNAQYTYAMDSRIQGAPLKVIATPAERFAGIREWYINTTRSLK
ncbi:MAG: ABC transporter substrate-binding protein [Patescibacteria group bacterium]